MKTVTDSITTAAVIEVCFSQPLFNNIPGLIDVSTTEQTSLLSGALWHFRMHSDDIITGFVGTSSNLHPSQFLRA